MNSHHAHLGSQPRSQVASRQLLQMLGTAEATTDCRSLLRKDDKRYDTD